MAIQNTPEERQLMKLIEKMPVPVEEQQTWNETIRNEGLNEELAEEIRRKLVTVAEGETLAPARARMAADLARLVRSWRLGKGSHNFHRR